MHGVEALCLARRELHLAHPQDVEALFQEVLQDRSGFALFDCVRLDDAKSSLDGHGFSAAALSTARSACFHYRRQCSLNGYSVRNSLGAAACAVATSALAKSEMNSWRGISTPLAVRRR